MWKFIHQNSTCFRMQWRLHKQRNVFTLQDRKNKVILKQSNFCCAPHRTFLHLSQWAMLKTNSVIRLTIFQIVKKKIKMIKWRPCLNKHQIWVISCTVFCDYQITVENIQNLHSFYFLPPPPFPTHKKKIIIKILSFLWSSTKACLRYKINQNIWLAYKK